MCELLRCGSAAYTVVDHPGRPEGLTAVCEYHRRIVVRELLEERDNRSGRGLRTVTCPLRKVVSSAEKPAGERLSRIWGGVGR